MGCLVVFSLVAVLVSVLIGYYAYTFSDLPPLPDIPVKYWGPGEQKGPDDKSIKPFKVDFPQKDLKLLKEKLDSHRQLVAPLEGVGFNYGMNTEYLNTFIQYWKTSYNWTERQAYINSVPHYTTSIGGLKIHFIHVKPDAVAAKGKKVLPLLLLHGWPGSVLEFYKIFPLLTKPRPDADFVFEVIAPSLPGYGFSQAPAKPGMGTAHMGAIFIQLMERLGFKKFSIQGGDWGALIGKEMAVLHSDRVLAYHSNFCMGDTPSSRFKAILAYFFPSFFMNEDKIEKYKNQFAEVFLLEMGYCHLQATKPDTVGVALTDSPVGLAAYQLEKFSTWTDNSYRNLPDGGLSAYNKDELLDNIMLYWLTKSITTSMRLYSENLSKNYLSLGLDRYPVKVPSMCAQFPNEILYYPPSTFEGTTYENLISVTDMAKGGHFAAFEQPQLLADDLWRAFKILLAQKNNI